MEIVWLKSAVGDLERVQQFIMALNPAAASAVAAKIKSVLIHLTSQLELGKPVEDPPGYRDLNIPFGAGSYVIRYRCTSDTIYIVHLRHCRENKFN